MSWLCVATLTLAAQPAGAESADTKSSAPVVVESGNQSSEFERYSTRGMRQLVHDALRLEATTRGQPEHEQAVRGLISLYQQITQNLGLPYGERLRLERRVRGRLRSVAKRLIRDRGRQASAKAGQNTNTSQQPKESAARAAPQATDERVDLGGRQTSDPGQAFVDMLTTSTKPESWEANGGRGRAALFQRGGGGVANLAQQPANAPRAGFPFGAAAPGGGRGGDLGEDLVELIQQVIAPDTWDVNGGPGTIVYYRPL